MQRPTRASALCHRGAWGRVLLLLLLCVTGCATSHGVRDFAGGLRVHTFRRDHANAHVVVQGQNYLLFDAGLAENGERLERDLRAAGLEPARLRAIILSHGHADHAGGALHFQRRFHTPVVVGRGDTGMLARGRNDRLCPVGVIARARFQGDQAARYDATTADVLVDQPTPLQGLTGINGTLWPLPGHTPGSLVVDLGEAALVGDLFRGALIGSGAELHFYHCDLPGNRRDVDALLTRLAPRAETFFTGHLGPVSRQAARGRFPVGAE